MQKALICGAVVALLTAASVAQAQDMMDRDAAYRVLTGDEPDAADPAPMALGAWPGGPPGLLAVVALEDADDHTADTLGTLQAGLVARRGTGFVLAASDESSEHPEPERTIVPSAPEIAIDQATFRIAPHETALGVDVSESLNTTSTLAGASSLVLYRRVGAGLVSIFSAATDDSILDKTEPRARTQATRHIVRFAPHVTRGFYDLVLVQTGARTARTYVWSGTRYEPLERRKPGW